MLYFELHDSAEVPLPRDSLKSYMPHNISDFVDNNQNQEHVFLALFHTAVVCHNEDSRHNISVTLNKNRTLFVTQPSYFHCTHTQCPLFFINTIVSVT